MCDPTLNFMFINLGFKDDKFVLVITSWAN